MSVSDDVIFKGTTDFSILTNSVIRDSNNFILIVPLFLFLKI